MKYINKNQCLAPSRIKNLNILSLNIKKRKLCFFNNVFITDQCQSRSEGSDGALLTAEKARNRFLGGTKPALCA